MSTPNFTLGYFLYLCQRSRGTADDRGSATPAGERRSRAVAADAQPAAVVKDLALGRLRKRWNWRWW